MLEITTAPDCGNAPKQAYVRDMLSACARGDRDTVSRAVADDWTHRIAGRAATTGAEATDAVIAALSPAGLEAVHFSVLMSHGRLVSAMGTLRTASEVSDFCCVITFSGHGKNALIAECVTFVASPTHG